MAGPGAPEGSSILVRASGEWPHGAGGRVRAWVLLAEEAQRNRGRSHPCEGTGVWSRRPGDGMGYPGNGSLLSPSLGCPALAVRVAACLLAWAPGEGPILVRALGVWPPSGRVTAWVTPVEEAR